LDHFPCHSLEQSIQQDIAVFQQYIIHPEKYLFRLTGPNQGGNGQLCSISGM